MKAKNTYANQIMEELSIDKIVYLYPLSGLDSYN